MTKLIDPSAGEYLYEYNSWGEVIKETSPKGLTEYVYDGYGKIIQKKITGDGTTGSVPTNMVSDYTYDPVTKQITQLLLTNADGNNTTYTYTYDSYYRPLEITEENPHASFIKEYTYDSFGRILTEENTALNKSNNRTTSKIIHHTWQNGVLIRLRESNSSGNKLWELQEMNARGQITKAGLGHTGMLNQNTYDVYGLPTEQKILKSGTEIFRHNYTWNTQQVLLTSRTTTLFSHSGSSWSESFVYDAMDRLIQWTDPLGVNTQSYDDRGRIEENSLAGEYLYETTTTYRQKTINLNTEGQAYYSGHQIQQVVYNNFKQPVEIVEENRDKISFRYNAAGIRSHMQWGRTPASGGSWGTPRYHNHYSTDGSMEILEDAVDGSTTFTLFIGGDAYTSPVIWRSKQGSTTTNEYLYLHRDHLGSIVAITDVNGVVKEKRHFDAWGNIAKLQDGAGVDLSSFTYTNRGYTGHEHLTTVGLIHMNGRLYDPLLHRFLMPDNYIQDPYNTQNFNRYGYVLNNPLRYTDPSGELTKSEFDEIIINLQNSDHGGYWNEKEGVNYYQSMEEALGWTIGFMHEHQSWGLYTGWASSSHDI